MSEAAARSPEVEAAMARDRRFGAIHLGIEIATELSHGRPLHLLMQQLREDADRAMADFALVNCGDLTAVQALQSRVFCFQYAFAVFDGILAKGRLAEQQVLAEDRMNERDDR